MKRNLLLFISLLAFFSLIQCSDNPVTDTKNGGGGGGATPEDTVAMEHFEEMGDSIAALEDMDAEELKNMSFANIRSGFETVLATDADNSIAHLGLAMLEILELNYDEDIWEIVDSLDVWGDRPSGDSISFSPPDRHHTLIGREFEYLVGVPFSMGVRMATQFPSNVTLGAIQDLIRDKVIPALGRSLGHLEDVEAHYRTPIRIMIDDNGVKEWIKIDMGEIRLFHASVLALRAGFRTAIAYDLDLYGPDGTYNWIDDYDDLGTDDWMWCSEAQLDTVPEPDELTLIWGQSRNDEMRDSILVRVLHHNLTNRSGFLTLRDGGTVLALARTDLLAMLDELEASARAIRSRTGETEENVIKLADLTELDSDIKDDADKPNFAAGFTKVEHIINFVDDLLRGPVLFREELGPRDETYQWSMDLGRFFSPAVADWKTKLPYYRWNLPTGAWIESVLQFSWEWDNGGWWYDDWVWVDDHCEWVSWDNIGWIRYYNREFRFIEKDFSIEFLDGPQPGGTPIDLDVERIPYFPDYTLHAIFPGQTRAKWLQLDAILN